jgi:excisionase family DNA binding protein
MCEAGKIPCVRIGVRRLFSRDWLVSKGVDIPAAERGGLVTVKDACRLLGVSARTLITYTKDGTIPSVNLCGKNVRYSVPELTQWIESRNKGVYLPDSPSPDTRQPNKKAVQDERKNNETN